MSCWRGDKEDFYCEILLLDETRLCLTTQEQRIKKRSKCSALLDHVFYHLDLMETDYFGLRYKDKHLQSHWLEPCKSLRDHKGLMETGPPFTMYFGVRFYAKNQSQLKEEVTRYQFYLQVKQDVLQGRVPCLPHTATELAALTLQAELGDYESGNLDPGYASVYRFTPNQNEELEQKAEAQHRSLRGLTPGEAEQRFLEIVQMLDMYGVDMHPVFGEDRINYLLGLTPSGVLVFREKVQVGQYLWPQIMRINFKGTHFELRVRSKDNGETSYYFEASNRAACKKLWKCCVETLNHLILLDIYRPLNKCMPFCFNSGRTMHEVERDPTCHLPRPCQVVHRRRSKTYPRRMAHVKLDRFYSYLYILYIIFFFPLFEWRATHCLFSFVSFSGLFGSRGKSPKFPRQQSRPPPGSGAEPFLRYRNLSPLPSHSSQVNHMVDSATQWEAGLQHQQERNQADPAYRHSRHACIINFSKETLFVCFYRRSPDKQARHKLWKHIEWELVDPIGFTDEQLKEIPYTLVETKGDPVKLCLSHSPNTHRHRRRSATSDGARSVLTDVYKYALRTSTLTRS
uniref:Erythrocyte membrane protein band 4.1-like 4A n=1 Tax=Eptatretus burgeri TaxID=7764 RepID=A0A8C4QH95_EPTBU